MDTPDRDDDGDLLIGYRLMSEFARDEGYPVSTSTMQKRGSPAIGTGPEFIGYFRQHPATTKGLMRKWLLAELRSDRPSPNPRKGRSRGSEDTVDVG